MTELRRGAPCFPHGRQDTAAGAARALRLVADDAPHVDREVAVMRAHPERVHAYVMHLHTLDRTSPPEAA